MFLKLNHQSWIFMGFQGSLSWNVTLDIAGDLQYLKGYKLNQLSETMISCFKILTD